MEDLNKLGKTREWNVCDLRRSITLRSNKMYSDMVLEYLFNKETDKIAKNNLKKRIDQQNKFVPKDMAGKIVKKDLRNEMFHCAVSTFQLLLFSP